MNATDSVIGTRLTGAQVTSQMVEGRKKKKSKQASLLEKPLPL